MTVDYCHVCVMVHLLVQSQQIQGSRKIKLGLVTKLWAGQLKIMVEFLADISLSLKASGLALRPTQPLAQWVPRSLSQSLL